jgi:hypothetical protein
VHHKHVIKMEQGNANFTIATLVAAPVACSLRKRRRLDQEGGSLPLPYTEWTKLTLTLLRCL